MADNPIKTPLPADLPENWLNTQTIAATGADVGLSKQHGYNYLMQQVNAAQKGVNLLGSSIAGLTPATLGAVPNTRKVNGLPLTSDINLTPEDIGVTAKRTCIVVGTSTAGWTEADCDFLCDGVDDQVEIQAAIDNAMIGSVYILPGMYLLSQPIRISTAVSLTGAGYSKTSLRRVWTDVSISKYIIDINANCRVSNLQIGVFPVSSSGDFVGIYVHGHNTIFLNHLYFTDNYVSITSLIDSLISTQRIFVSDCVISGLLRPAWGDWYITNCNITRGVDCEYSNNVKLIGNVISTSSDSNKILLKLYGSTSNLASKNVIIGNSFTGYFKNFQIGIDCNNAKNNIILGNVFYNSGNEWNASSYPIRVNNGSSNNLVLGNILGGKNYSNSGTNNVFANNIV